MEIAATQELPVELRRGIFALCLAAVWFFLRNQTKVSVTLPIGTPGWLAGASLLLLFLIVLGVYGGVVYLMVDAIKRHRRWARLAITSVLAISIAAKIPFLASLAGDAMAAAGAAITVFLDAYIIRSLYSRAGTIWFAPKPRPAQ